MIVDDRNKDKEAITTPLLDSVLSIGYPAIGCYHQSVQDFKSTFDVHLFSRASLVFQLVSQFLTMNEVHVFMRLCSADHRATLHSDFSFFPGNKHVSLPTWVGAIKQRQYDRNMKIRDQVLQYVGKCWFCALFSVGIISLVFFGDVQISLLEGLGLITLVTCVPFFGGALLFHGLSRCSLTKVASAHAVEIENPLALVGQRHRYKGLSLQAPVSECVLITQP
jgi:hypothetical protein